MKFIMMIFPLPELIMAGGALIGGALNRGGSRGAINRQNEYNSPPEQVKRLREAGLPMAAMTGGMAGNQSVVQETGSGVQEAVQGGIDTHIRTTLQRKQLELMEDQMNMIKQQTETEKAQTRKVWADALMSDTNARVATDMAQWRLNREGSDLSMPNDYAPSNQIQAEVREQKTKQVEQDYRKNQNALATIELKVQNELYRDGTLSNTSRQHLVNMVMQSDTMKANMRIMGQNFDMIEMQRKVEKTLIDALEVDGMSTGEAFMHTLLQGALGGQFVTPLVGGAIGASQGGRQTSIYNDNTGENKHYHFPKK